MYDGSQHLPLLLEHMVQRRLCQTPKRQLECVKAANNADAQLCAGPFDGCQHLLLLLDHTVHRKLRQALLQLLAALVAPSKHLTADDASAAARQNGHALVAAGGVPLLVDIVAGAALAQLSHFCQSHLGCLCSRHQCMICAFGMVGLSGGAMQAKQHLHVQG